MIKTNFIVYIYIFFLIGLGQSKALENKILFKVNNEIITSQDIAQEEKYLTVLNLNLKKIEKSKLNKIAKNSILKEKIKEIELKKYFTIDKTLDDENLQAIIVDLYTKIGMKSEKEFVNYLKLQNLELRFITKKIAIEMLWNNLIFNKFNNQVMVNENFILEQIKNDIKKIGVTRELLLSEILIKNNKELNLKKTYDEILESNRKIGFNNTANIYSKSDSAKIGGKIGWVHETSLTGKIQENLKNLKKGQISKPIKISDNYIIIKIEEVKLNKKKVDINKILKQRIAFEKNQQLERFSLAYLNRVKQNTTVNEL